MLDELFVPNLAPESIPALTDSDSELKVVFFELSVDFLEGLANVEPNLLIHAIHRHVEQELEVVLELVHFGGHL